MLWREAIAEGDTDEWEIAVVDVEWVTGHLCEETFYNAATEDVTQLKRYVNCLLLCHCLTHSVHGYRPIADKTTLGKHSRRKPNFRA